MTTIDTLLGYWAGYCPGKTAIVFGDRRVSFDEHHRRVLRCASALRSLGLRHGDSVAVMLPNCIELLELYRATALVGVVVVPVSPLLQARGVATVLHDCSAAATSVCGGSNDESTRCRVSSATGLGTHAVK